MAEWKSAASYLFRPIAPASKRKVPEFIDTVRGKVYFVKTEVEDKYGKWKDDYYTKDGYWVIHRGKEHDVYKLKKVI
jgi:hypothetical protein